MSEQPKGEILQHRSGCAALTVGRPQRWIEGDEWVCNCGAAEFFGFRPVALPAPPQPTQGWQPIETAPKNGKRVLLHPGPNGYSVVGRRSLMNRWWETLPGKYQIVPTHWMPLPDPPSKDS